MLRIRILKIAFITVGLSLLTFGCKTTAVSTPATHESTPHSGGAPAPPTAAPGQIEMRFTAEPERPKPGEDVSLVLTPVSRAQPQAKIDLEMAHTKKIHLIMVNDDLSWFEHVHPTELNDGTYRILQKFPSPGAYALFADYKLSKSSSRLSPGSKSELRKTTSSGLTVSSARAILAMTITNAWRVADIALRFSGRGGTPY